MTPESIVAVATGTTAFTSFLVWVVKTLWTEKQRSDAEVLADVRAQRDLAIQQRDVAIAGWREQTAATKDLAVVVTADNAAQLAATKALASAVERQTRADAKRKP